MGQMLFLVYLVILVHAWDPCKDLKWRDCNAHVKCTWHRRRCLQVPEICKDLTRSVCELTEGKCKFDRNKCIGGLPSAHTDAKTGNSTFLILFGHYNELADSVIDKSKLDAIYKQQTQRYFKWASDNQMDFQVQIEYVNLGISERDDNNDCRSHPGVFETDFDVNTYDSVAYYVLTNTGCSGPCAFGGHLECTSHYTHAVSCNWSGSHRYLCAKVFVHEVLHSLGLGYHISGYKCTISDVEAKKSWRDCSHEEYGGSLDMLGSVNDKGSFGICAKTRYDLGWLQSPRDIAIVTTSRKMIIASLGGGISRWPRAAMIKFTDPLLKGLGEIWLEYRGPHGFDWKTKQYAKGWNSKGVVAFNWGTNLIDLFPNGNRIYFVITSGHIIEYTLIMDPEKPGKLFETD